MRYIISIIVLFLFCFGTYYIFQDIKEEKWKEGNCKKIYYERKAETCVRYGTRPVMIGLVVIRQRYCMEYKDTLVLDWKYKCPEKY